MEDLLVIHMWWNEFTMRRGNRHSNICVLGIERRWGDPSWLSLTPSRLADLQLRGEENVERRKDGKRDQALLVSARESREPLPFVSKQNFPTNENWFNDDEIRDLSWESLGKILSKYFLENTEIFGLLDFTPLTESMSIKFTHYTKHFKYWAPCKMSYHHLIQIY